MREVIGVFASVLRHVFVAPVSEGAPQPSQWPQPLRWVVALATAVILTLGLVAAFGDRLRALGTLISVDHFMTFPNWAISPMLWIGVFVMTLLFSATLRTHWAVTVVVWFTVAPQMLMLSAAGGALGMGMALLAMLVLAVAPWVVRRRRWHVGEVVLVWLMLQVAVLLPLWLSPAQGLGLDARTLSMLNMQLALTALAAPALATAGYAAVEITVNASQWLAHDLRRLGVRAPVSRWLLVAVLLTGAWRGWSVVRSLLSDERGWVWSDFVSTVLIVAAAVGLCLLLWNRSPLISGERRAVWPVGRPAQLAEVWSPWTLLMGVSLAVTLWPHNLLASLGTILGVFDVPESVRQAIDAVQRGVGGAVARAAVRAGFAVGLFVLAWRRARRGNAALVLLASCTVALWLPLMMNLVTGGRLTVDWNVRDLALVTSGVAVVWLVVTAVRGRLHNGVLLGVWVVWLLPQLYQFRQVMSDPTELAGLVSPIALVLLGLLWRLATDGNFVRGDNDAFPRTSRVLLLVANTAVGMMVLAVVALGGGQAPFTAVNNWVELGDSMIGGPLMLAAMLAPFLITAWTARISDDPPPGPVPAVAPAPAWSAGLPTAHGQVGGQAAPGAAPFRQPHP
ncbi:hypothetical protein [Aestuariimicrobium ganziense]|uniref:hypothetical protein n=1 Tax=Aestuariimicrobium ganziense TaxID=2773677 RepID=UPI00194564A3|nr:hypothetical protein [Aestuariimicrobium ganziense]